MKVNGLGSFGSVDEFVKNKIDLLESSEKTFSELFFLMFSESDNIMAETNDGYHIIRTTYGQCRDEIYKVASKLSSVLSLQKGIPVGLYMDNSLAWIQMFWAILMNGYVPLLLNTKFEHGITEDIIKEYGISFIISDGEKFSCDTYTADEINSLGEKEDFEPTWENRLIVLSSGTSENVKLCIYTGASFCSQIKDSYNIICRSKQVKKHYDGNLKHLALLPFYHIFGLAAVYMWFAFFSRTFVFLNDMTPYTLLNTVKKHKVTHIFAVPMVWNRIYSAAMKEIRARGEKTYGKFLKALEIVNLVGVETPPGRLISRLAFREIRENIFGDSICFMVSGGSMVSKEVLAFFNGIGYHLANGYGTSEIGITSVDLSPSSKDRIKGSVGKPLGAVTYAVSSDGTLWVRGESTCSYVIQGRNKSVLANTEWYNTRDIVSLKDGDYYVEGRLDSMIASSDGENINPDMTENLMSVDGAVNICIVESKDSLGSSEPVLIVQAGKYDSPAKISRIAENAKEQLEKAGMRSRIRKTVLTTDPLILENEFKLNRKRIAKDYAEGRIHIIDPTQAEGPEVYVNDELREKITGIFASALDRDISAIGPNDDFFTDLNGTSLDYFTVLSEIEQTFGISIGDSSGFNSVNSLCGYISGKLEN